MDIRPADNAERTDEPSPSPSDSAIDAWEGEGGCIPPDEAEPVSDASI